MSIDWGRVLVLVSAVALGAAFPAAIAALYIRRVVVDQGWAQHGDTRKHVAEQAKKSRDYALDLHTRNTRDRTAEHDRTRRILEHRQTYTDPVPAAPTPPAPSPSFLTYTPAQAPATVDRSPGRQPQHRRVQ